MAGRHPAFDRALAERPLKGFPHAERELRDHSGNFSPDALSGRIMAGLLPGPARLQATRAHLLAAKGNARRARDQFEKLALEAKRRTSRGGRSEVSSVQLFVAAAAAAFLISDAAAAEAYGKAYADDPTYPELAVLLGMFLVRSGEFARAKAPLQASIDLWTSRLPAESDHSRDAVEWRLEYGSRIREAELLLQACEQQGLPA